MAHWSVLEKGLRICGNITIFFWWGCWATSDSDPCYQGGKSRLNSLVLSGLQGQMSTRVNGRVIDRLTEKRRLLLSLVAATYHSSSLLLEAIGLSLDSTRLWNRMWSARSWFTVDSYWSAAVRDACWHSRCVQVTGLDASWIEIKLLRRVILFCTLLLSVVRDLSLAEAAEVPYIVFSDANLSGLTIPSSSGSSEVDTLTYPAPWCEPAHLVQLYSR